MDSPLPPTPQEVFDIHLLESPGLIFLTPRFPTMDKPSRRMGCRLGWVL